MYCQPRICSCIFVQYVIYLKYRTYVLFGRSDAMRYCTFGSVILTLMNGLRDDSSLPQVEFAVHLFDTFFYSDVLYDFDAASVSRWIKGTAPVTSVLKQYYMTDDHADLIGKDIMKYFLKKFVDLDMTVQNIVDLVMNDMSISERKRHELMQGSDSESDTDKCDMLGRVVYFTLERKQISQNELAAARSESVHDRVIGMEVPSPCKYFCGRDKELSEFHEIVKFNSKVFLTGIPGIGKSEFIKAYAKQYRKEFSDILYLNYSGDLKAMVTAAMFADDISDNPETMFRAHHKYFHNLGSNVLLIVDNFNVSESADKFLNQMLHYNCKIVFTTRSIIENAVLYELKEIESVDVLYDFAANFFGEIESCKATVTEIIETVHHHTLAVELAARIMQKGLRTPEEILAKLKENSADPHTADKVNVKKDGINTKATYFEHLKTLCDFDILDIEMKNVMRNMVFIPESGIRSRKFAKWLEIDDLNPVNDLIETGYISNPRHDIIFLHPIIRDIAAAELAPKFSECSVFIENVHKVCLDIGQYFNDHELITSTAVNIVRYAENDDVSAYLLFAEDALGFLDNYRDEIGMYFIIGKIGDILNDTEAGSARDRALYYNYRARCKSIFENDNKKAITYQQKALNYSDVITDPALLANLNMNMGALYHDNNFFVKAKEYMEKAISIFEDNKIVSADYIAMKRNYATVLAEQGKNIEAHTVLAETARIAIAANSSELAGLLYDAACINVRMKFYEEAIHLFKESFHEYEKFLDEDTLNARIQAALYLLHQSGCNFIESEFVSAEQIEN